MSIVEYIEGKGWEYKVVDSSRGKQLNVRVCPYCKDKNWHFYIHAETGQFKCHKGDCNSEGGFYTLKKDVGDIVNVTSFKQEHKTNFNEEIPVDEQVHYANELLWDSLNALHYIHERGWTRKTVEHFRLGYSKEDNIEWLWYPSFDKEDHVSNVKKRSLPPAEKSFKRIEGGLSVLYNEEALRQGFEELIITEGESDCIAVYEFGFPNVVGVPNGAGGIKPEWVTQLDKFQRIYLAYDSDQPGQMGAQKMANRLGIERCSRLILPEGVKDINQFLTLGKTHNDFQELLNNAERFNVEDVRTLGGVIQEVMYRLTNKDEVVKLALPWEQVNKLCGGFQAGDLITIGGRPKVGKTTMALNLLHYYATNEIPSLLFELEMRPERLLPRLIAMHLKKDSSLIVSYEEYAEAYASLKEVPLYIAYKYSRPNWDNVSDTLRMSVRRYGIKFIVFDNLHFLCRDMREQTREVSVMVQNFKLLAEELELPIVIIARPSKALGKKLIRGVDLKDSADIEGDSDIIIILNREEKPSTQQDMEGVLEDKTMVLIDKARYASGGATYLRAIDKEARFVEY